MSGFIPNKHHLREVLLHNFIAKKSAAETYHLLVDIFGEHALSNTTCKEWFRRFKNDDFDIQENHPKNLKTLNWKNHWLKIVVKHNQNWQQH